MLKSLPLKQLKNIFLEGYSFPMPDEGGENKICHFLSFLSLFLKILTKGREVYHFMDEGADTDLMFQFYLPK